MILPAEEPQYNLSECSEDSFNEPVEQVPENGAHDERPVREKRKEKTLASQDQLVRERKSSTTDRKTMQQHTTNDRSLYRPRCVLDDCESESEESIRNRPCANVEGDRENHMARPQSIHRARE